MSVWRPPESSSGQSGQGLSHSDWKVAPVAAMKQKRSLVKFLWVNSLRSGIQLGLWVALWAW